MTKAHSTFTVQVPAARARQVVPGRLSIGTADLEVGTESTTKAAALGQDARRFSATWSKRAHRGRAYVEIRPTSKLTSEIVVSLEAPRGIVWRLLGTGQGLKALADLFGQALRYEIETRGAEEADAYDVRRTTPELVKARSA
jgi:hypothetical protein